MNFQKNLFLLFFSIILVKKSFSQTDIGLNFSKSIFQHQMVNPSFMPENRIIISLPSNYTGFYNNFGGFIVRNGQTQVNNLSENESQFNIVQNISFFGFGVKIRKNGFLSFSQTVNMDFGISGDKNLLRVLTEGNAPFIGQTLQIAPKISGQAYNEWTLGYAHQVGKLSIGGKIRRYNGWAATKTTDNASLKLTTNNDAYQLGFDVDYSLDASENVAEVLSDLKTQPNLSNINSRDDIFNLNNRGGGGFGFDIGASYEITPKLSLSASAINIGSIKWNGSRYSSKASFSIEGVNIDQLLSDSTLSINAPNIDTVFQKMNFKKEDISFNTNTPSTYTLSASYKLSSKLIINGMYGKSARGDFFAINGTTRLRQWIEAGLTYSVRNNSFSNIGANIAVKVGPVQVYALSDNILATSKPSQNYNTNFRIGANIAIGKR